MILSVFAHHHQTPRTKNKFAQEPSCNFWTSERPPKLRKAAFWARKQLPGPRTKCKGLKSCTVPLLKPFSSRHNSLLSVSTTPSILSPPSLARRIRKILSCSVAPFFPFFWWLPHQNGPPKKEFPFFSRGTEQLRIGRFWSHRNRRTEGVKSFLPKTLPTARGPRAASREFQPLGFVSAS